MEFCKRLSEMPEEKASGHVYRLPTEAEWEYACRAGTTSAYNTGDSKDSLDQAGWYGDNAGSKSIDSEEKFREAKGNIKQYALGLIANGNTPHPVGRKKPNACGLYDMHGNLWEWCSDWHGDYPSRDVTDPKGPSVGKERVWMLLGRGHQVPVCGEELGSAWGHLQLPRFSGGDASGEIGVFRCSDSSEVRYFSSTVRGISMKQPVAPQNSCTACMWLISSVHSYILG